MANTTTASITNNVLYGGGSGYSTATAATNTNWVTPNNYNAVMTVGPNTADPALNVTGKFFVNGIDLEERLKTIEKVLAIPERDVKLEAKHPKLKKMYNDYIRELSKYRMWEEIKGEDK